MERIILSTERGTLRLTMPGFLSRIADQASLSGLGIRPARA